jgi:hypothetical protein
MDVAHGTPQPTVWPGNLYIDQVNKNLYVADSYGPTLHVFNFSVSQTSVKQGRAGENGTTATNYITFNPVGALPLTSRGWGPNPGTVQLNVTVFPSANGGYDTPSDLVFLANAVGITKGDMVYMTNKHSGVVCSLPYNALLTNDTTNKNNTQILSAITAMADPITGTACNSLLGIISDSPQMTGYKPPAYFYLLDARNGNIIAYNLVTGTQQLMCRQVLPSGYKIAPWAGFNPQNMTYGLDMDRNGNIYLNSWDSVNSKNHPSMIPTIYTTGSTTSIDLNKQMIVSGSVSYPIPVGASPNDGTFGNSSASPNVSPLFNYSANVPGTKALVNLSMNISSDPTNMLIFVYNSQNMISPRLQLPMNTNPTTKIPGYVVGNSNIEASFVLNDGDTFYIMILLNASPGTAVSGGILVIEKLPIQTGGRQLLDISPLVMEKTISVRVKKGKKTPKRKITKIIV